MTVEQAHTERMFELCYPLGVETHQPTLDVPAGGKLIWTTTTAATGSTSRRRSAGLSVVGASRNFPRSCTLRRQEHSGCGDRNHLTSQHRWCRPYLLRGSALLSEGIDNGSQIAGTKVRFRPRASDREKHNAVVGRATKADSKVAAFSVNRHIVDHFKSSRVSVAAQSCP